MKKLSVLFLCLVLSACEKDPISRTATNNSEFHVDFLFEKDGCKVYRFKDAGNPVYFTDCRGKASYTYEESGKNHTEYQVETVNAGSK